ncbi:MAG TPA: choice-of-anchor D domain-containing protein [Solirubrobacterales bacterium]|nr:choice-of-anchor D domain-containing protein [Solirubrobacterales bacterium]
MLFAFLAAIALRPADGLAAPVEPAEPPQLAIVPGSYDFGLQPLNGGSRETSFQLRNTGSEAFQVGSPEIAGPGREVFWTGYSPCYGSFLQPGESCSVQVYFGPRDAVEYAAQFRVSVGAYSFGADLAGTGGRASFSPDSNPTDFGVAKVGSAGTTREIFVTNTGNMPGGVFIAVIAGGAIGSFQILDESCTGVELVPAATCTLQIRFQPVSEGVKKAMLGLFGESEGPTPIVLTGVGTAPDPAPAVDPAPPAAAGSSVGASPVAGAAAGPARSHKRKPKIRRRPRRANLHSARRAVDVDLRSGPVGR